MTIVFCWDSLYFLLSPIFCSRSILIVIVKYFCANFSIWIPCKSISVFSQFLLFPASQILKFLLLCWTLWIKKITETENAITLQQKGFALFSINQIEWLIKISGILLGQSRLGTLVDSFIPMIVNDWFGFLL